MRWLRWANGFYTGARNASALNQGSEGHPLIHMHMACGRDANTVTGCIRRGVKVWKVMEVILFELAGNKARRVLEEDVGFKLLQP